MFSSLIKNQFKRIGRDKMILMLMVYPIILGFIGRYLVPIIQEATLSNTFNLYDHYHTLMIFFVIVNPVLFGDVLGLMLLDEREDNTLLAVSVSPVPIHKYLLSSALIFIIASTISGVIITWALGFYHVPLSMSIIINFLASLGVGYPMLLINNIATNKVEGFAVVKATSGILLLPCVIGVYFTGFAHFIFGLLPAFWPAVALANYSNGYTPPLNVWTYILIGTIYVVLCTYALYKVTLKKLY